MLVLFDHGTPRGLARLLPEHTVITAKARGWDRLSNGELLKMSEAAAVDLLITTDQKIRYQQNLADRKIAIVFWPVRRNGHAYDCTMNASPPS